jgi:hypothetical protein
MSEEVKEIRVTTSGKVIQTLCGARGRWDDGKG